MKFNKPSVLDGRLLAIELIAINVYELWLVQKLLVCLYFISQVCMCRIWINKTFRKIKYSASCIVLCIVGKLKINTYFDQFFDLWPNIAWLLYETEEIGAKEHFKLLIIFNFSVNFRSFHSFCKKICVMRHYIALWHLSSQILQIFFFL